MLSAGEKSENPLFSSVGHRASERTFAAPAGALNNNAYGIGLIGLPAWRVGNALKSGGTKSCVYFAKLE
jgi:hypothetical protein